MRKLALRGSLSLSDRSRLASELEDLVASGARTVHLDLSAVTHVDDHIARLFLSTSWRLEKDNRMLMLVGVQPKVRRMIKWHGAGHLIVR